MTLPNPELARVCREFALLLGSGIGTAEAAFLLAREEQMPLGQLLNALGQYMDEGHTLAEAMELSGSFPEYVRIMVRIGEETGHLEQTLTGLADYYEENHRTLRQIRSAVGYPAMVFVLMLLVVGVLLVKVLPVFDRVYGSLGTRLTGPAAGLLYAGQLLDSALPMLLVLAAGAAALWLRPSFREKLTAFWRQRYGDRGIARKFNNARFARALALGLSSGMDVENSLTLAGTLLAEIPGAAQRRETCVRSLEEGASFADALAAAQLIPPAQCRLLQAGIRGGIGDRVMETVAEALMEDARESLERIISGIEPVMVLISSLLVGLILLSVMLPLADILAVLG
ncbi:MAG: type II secretion system F family protein [Oscillospiraceae bacterium]